MNDTHHTRNMIKEVLIDVDVSDYMLALAIDPRIIRPRIIRPRDLKDETFKVFYLSVDSSLFFCCLYSL